MTKDQLIQYLRVCADLAAAPKDGIAHVAIVPLRQAIQLLESSCPRQTLYRSGYTPAETIAVPDGWCPICGGQNGEHKSGCEDGSEVL